MTRVLLPVFGVLIKPPTNVRMSLLLDFAALSTNLKASTVEHVSVAVIIQPTKALAIRLISLFINRLILTVPSENLVINR